MKGEQSAETPVVLPANLMWEVYRGLGVGALVGQLLPHVVGKVETLLGDGGVGTILKVTFPPGTPGIGYMKEKFTKVDDEKRVKETQVIEGSFGEMGFDVCKIRLEIIEKNSDSSIVRSTVLYEIDDSKAQLASFVSTKHLEIIAETVAKYIADSKSAAA